MIFETSAILGIIDTVVKSTTAVATGIYTTTEILNETVQIADEMFTTMGNKVENFGNGVSDFFDEVGNLFNW